MVFLEFFQFQGQVFQIVSEDFYSGVPVLFNLIDADNLPFIRLCILEQRLVFFLQFLTLFLILILHLHVLFKRQFEVAFLASQPIKQCFF